MSFGRVSPGNLNKRHIRMYRKTNRYVGYFPSAFSILSQSVFMTLMRA